MQTVIKFSAHSHKVFTTSEVAEEGSACLYWDTAAQSRIGHPKQSHRGHHESAIDMDFNHPIDFLDLVLVPNLVRCHPNPDTFVEGTPSHSPWKHQAWVLVFQLQSKLVDMQTLSFDPVFMEDVECAV